jgi:ATP-dependent protease Clp ATPase subunit
VDDSLRCSFCKKPQNKVGKLISSPSDYPRAYICDECISVCVFIIEDDRAESCGEPEVSEPEFSESVAAHPLLHHPLASQLMEAIENWIVEESLGKDGLTSLQQVRDLANRMVRDALDVGNSTVGDG